MDAPHHSKTSSCPSCSCVVVGSCAITSRTPQFMWSARDGEAGALSFARLAHTLQEASAQALKTTGDRFILR